MRRIISKKEPRDKTVLWAKPSNDGSYLIEQIFGPNGWELFGEGSGGGGGGTLTKESDPVAMAAIAALEDKIPSTATSTNPLIDNNSLNNKLSQYQIKLTPGPNVSIVNNVISATSDVTSVNGKSGAVTLNATDLGIADVMSIKGDDTSANIQAKTGSVGDIWFANDTNPMQMYVYTADDGWVNVGEPNVDLSNYYNKSEVDTKLSGFSTAVPDETFNYSNSNVFTLSKVPQIVSQVWIDSTDSLTLVRVANISVNGSDVTINNQTFQAGDIVRIHYFI